jgi:hypothetical protein
VKQRAIKSLEIVILEKICESRRGRKSKLNKTIKLLLNCDALNLIRLIKNNRKRGEKVGRSFGGEVGMFGYGIRGCGRTG